MTMTDNPQPLPSRTPGATFAADKPPATATIIPTPGPQCSCPDGRIITNTPKDTQ
jgi:hypothetical protein